jgi:uncharacterized protein YqjF (DUF2071 family)
MKGNFLTTEWRKLAIANYKVDASCLDKYIPAGTELDEWEGNCFVSLVAFLFMNTKLRGITVPFHVNFEEVNLRFYVRYKEGNKWKRGVVFIKEFVPLYMVALIANTFYNEHYEKLKMAHTWKYESEKQAIEYRWMKERWHSFSVTTSPASQLMPDECCERFITEHYWGYTKSGNQTSAYEVRHPVWQVYDVLNHHIDVDFDILYGKDFAFLNGRQPHSVMLAEGSGIRVLGREK